MRIAYRTFGCRLNQYDTEAIRALIARERGFETVGQGEQADIYVINTCTVTARADANARKAIRRLHGEHPNAQIVVAGCYAQRAPEELAALPGVSLVVGAAERTSIGGALENMVSGGKRIRVSPIAEAKSFLEIPIGEMRERSRAVVKIQEGCNRHCTFCIIPKTRGRSRSRRSEGILQEVRRLVARAGYQEVVLTGVHLGDYGLDLGHPRRLTDLIHDILAIPGFFRLRLSSIEPTAVSDELIELIASEERFARHLHIPVQSAADSVLDRMRRGYTADDFVGLVERIAQRIPNCGIGTDVICGFPGETEAEFHQTFERLSGLPITYIHPFPYSLRPGSEAESYADDVTPNEKKRRTRALKQLSYYKNQSFRQAQLGKILRVLFESPKEKAEGTKTGWTDNYLRVRLHGEFACTGIRSVRIKNLTSEGLVGELVDAANE